MAANDDDANRPRSAMEPAVLTAAIVGLDADAAETLTLLLDILGWTVVTEQVVEALPDIPSKLVFIDEALFLDSSARSAPKIANCRTTVLVGSESSIAFIDTNDAKVYRAALPLDIAQLESIIANAH